MKVSLTRFAYLVAFLAVSGYALVTLRGPHGVRSLVDKQAQIKALEKRNTDLAREIERKRAHIWRLEHDASKQEREIRERYKLVKPGEKVYITGQP